VSTVCVTTVDAGIDSALDAKLRRDAREAARLGMACTWRCLQSIGATTLERELELHTTEAWLTTRLTRGIRGFLLDVEVASIFFKLAKAWLFGVCVLLGEGKSTVGPLSSPRCSRVLLRLIHCLWADQRVLPCAAHHTGCTSMQRPPCHDCARHAGGPSVWATGEVKGG
jgi:hypothetical protein